MVIKRRQRHCGWSWQLLHCSFSVSAHFRLNYIPFLSLVLLLTRETSKKNFKCVTVNKKSIKKILSIYIYPTLPEKTGCTLTVIITQYVDVLLLNVLNVLCKWRARRQIPLHRDNKVVLQRRWLVIWKQDLWWSCTAPFIYTLYNH